MHDNLTSNQHPRPILHQPPVRWHMDYMAGDSDDEVGAAARHASSRSLRQTPSPGPKLPAIHQTSTASFAWSPLQGGSTSSRSSSSKHATSRATLAATASTGTLFSAANARSVRSLLRSDSGVSSKGEGSSGGGVDAVGLLMQPHRRRRNRKHATTAGSTLRASASAPALVAQTAAQPAKFSPLRSKAASLKQLRPRRIGASNTGSSRRMQDLGAASSPQHRESAATSTASFHAPPPSRLAGRVLEPTASDLHYEAMKL